MYWGEQMNQKWLTIKYTIVMIFVFAGFLSAANAADGGSASGIVVGGETREATLSRSYDAAKSRCDKARENTQKKMSSFLATCSDDQKADMTDDDDDVDSKDEKKAAEKKKKIARAQKECREEFRSCQSMGDSEMDFAQYMTQMGGADMSAFSNMMGSDSKKKCSKYSQDKYDTKLDKMKTALDTKKEKLQKSQEDLLKNREAAQKEYNTLQKEFISAQEKKEEENARRAEEGLNQEAAYDKQVKEYEAKIRETNAAVFQLQQQEALMTSQRGLEVGLLQDALTKCQNDAIESRDKLKSALARGQASISGNVNKTLANCRQRAFKARDMQVQKFKSDLAILEMNISMKNAELQALQQSSQKLAQMYAKSLSDKQAKEQKQDDAFLKKQQQSWLEMSNMAKNMEDKNMQNQQVIAEAQTAVTTASNELAEFKGEEPLSDTKSLKELRDEANDAMASSKVEKMECKDAADFLAKYNAELAKSSSQPMPASTSSTGATP
jgi:hypothetical protein